MSAPAPPAPTGRYDAACASWVRVMAVRGDNGSPRAFASAIRASLSCCRISSASCSFATAGLYSFSKSKEGARGFGADGEYGTEP